MPHVNNGLQRATEITIIKMINGVEIPGSRVTESIPSSPEQIALMSTEAYSAIVEQFVTSMNAKYEGLNMAFFLSEWENENANLCPINLIIP